MDWERQTETVALQIIVEVSHGVGIEHFAQRRLDAKKHYEAYLNDEHKQFPHEMGLLLGYPIEDVRGFIEHNGCGCLYSGYWKVYRNVPVSYTHLDVYKRQLQARAQSRDVSWIWELLRVLRYLSARWHRLAIR